MGNSGVSPAAARARKSQRPIRTGDNVSGQTGSNRTMRRPRIGAHRRAPSDDQTLQLGHGVARHRTALPHCRRGRPGRSASTRAAKPARRSSSVTASPTVFASRRPGPCWLPSPGTAAWRRPTSVGTADPVAVLRSVGTRRWIWMPWSLDPRSGYRRVVVVGFSMGAAIALRHAAVGSAPGDAVVSVSSPSRWYIRESAPMRRVQWLLESPFGPLVGRGLGVRLGEPWFDLPASPVEAVGIDLRSDPAGARHRGRATSIRGMCCPAARRHRVRTSGSNPEWVTARRQPRRIWSIGSPPGRPEPE